MITAVSSSVGSASQAVVGTAEVTETIGYGQQSGDKVAWSLNSDCTDLAYTSTSNSSSWYGSDASYESSKSVSSVTYEWVQENHDSLSYVDSSFTFNSSYAGETLTLCYKFEDEDWQSYSDYTLEVSMIDSISVSSGSSSILVSGVSKSVLFSGSFVSSSDTVRLIRSSSDVSSSETSCEDSMSDQVVASFESGSTTVGVDTSSYASLDVSDDESGQTLWLCYKFGSEPYRLYQDISFIVAHVSSWVAEAGSVNVAVVNATKTWDLSGGNLMVNDSFRFIPTSKSCVDDDSSISSGSIKESSDGILTVGSDYSVSFTFEESWANENVTVCYMHGNGSEPWAAYGAVWVYVSELVSWYSSSGSRDVLVVGQSKEFIFEGYGVSTSDTVGWVMLNTSISNSSYYVDCSDVTTYALTSSSSRTTSVSSVTSGSLQNASVTLSLDSSAAGSLVGICYTFGSVRM
jgi:hypothetical protein